MNNIFKFKHASVDIILILDDDGTILKAQVPESEIDIWPILSYDVKKRAVCLLDQKHDDDIITCSENL